MAQTPASGPLRRSLAEHLDDHPLPRAPVELAAEDLLPGAEVNLPSVTGTIT
jgi:hypothetical protein